MKIQLLALLFISYTVTAQQQADVLIKNGRIIDGTGNSWMYGDISIKDGKITGIGKLGQVTAAKTIDATGLIIAPGFIDVHTHIEDDEKDNPTAANFIYDGV